jgi:nitroimidazol reductase NimA-like FMN-containing flavoprotein (pyridoxamine 5'-phosphate oxidase superfamily)
MTRHDAPTFRDLPIAESHALLARNHVGRIAYSFHNRVDIEPVHYVFADDAIYFRTEPGTKVATLAHVPWVAFEVDEVAGPFDWRSVVAHGTVYVLSDAGPDQARAAYRHALERLRELSPRALMEGDPVPERRVLLKVHLSEIAGREATSGASRAPRRQRNPQNARTGGR